MRPPVSLFSLYAKPIGFGKSGPCPSFGFEHGRGNAGFRPAQSHPDLRADEEQAEREKRGADRPLDEGVEVAMRDDQRAAKILLEARAEDETQQNRRRLEAQQQQQIAEEAEEQGRADVE